MQGRYGTDALSKFLVIAGVILAVISSAAHIRGLYIVAWVMIIWSYYRMFSKDYGQRSAENRWYLNKTYKIRSKFVSWKNQMAQSKDYHIYKCPSCKQKIRIPRGKGKIEIRCPKCSTTFIKRS